MVTSYYIMRMSARKEMDIADYYLNTFDTPKNDGSKKCRICLREGSVPIYSEQDTKGLAEALAAFADVNISEHDAYPKHLCKVCYKFLKDAILFRQTAKLTDELLKKPVKIEDEDSSLNLELEDSNLGTHYKEKIVESTHDYEDNIGEENPSPTPSKWDNECFAHIKLNVADKKLSPKVNCKKFARTHYKSHLKTHTKKNLSKMKPVVKESEEMLPPKVTCKICKKVYDRKYYKLHLTMHDPNHKKTDVCEICGKVFRLKSMYYGHRKVHESDFPFKCNQCPYRARQKHILKLHMATHTGEFKYACTECPARFHFISNMNIHIAKKHREPQFKCDSCDKRFHRRIAMQRHVEADHLGYRNHVCNICGKAFGYRNAMMKHQRGVHKREKLASGVTPAYLRAQLEDPNGTGQTSEISSTL